MPPSGPPPSDPTSLSKRTFVGGLPNNVQKETLRELFAPYGEVLDVTIKHTNRDTYAFIDYTSDQSMDAAIKNLNDFILDGHKIGVQRAKGPKERAKQREQALQVQRSEYRVHVGNLPDSATWQQIKDYVGQKANVVYCDILQETRGKAAIVEFASFRDMTDAIREFDGKEFMGNLIQLTEDRDHRFGPTRREIEQMRSDRKRGRSPGYDRHDDRKRRRYNSPDRYYDRDRRDRDRYPPSPRDRRRGDRDRDRSPRRHYSPDRDRDRDYDRRRGDRDRYSPDRRDRGDRHSSPSERRGRGDRRRNDRSSPRQDRDRRDRGKNERRRDAKPLDYTDDRNNGDNSQRMETRASEGGNYSTPDNNGASHMAPAQYAPPEERSSDNNESGGRRRRRQPSPEEEPAQ